MIITAIMINKAKRKFELAPRKTKCHCLMVKKQKKSIRKTIIPAPIYQYLLRSGTRYSGTCQRIDVSLFSFIWLKAGARRSGREASRIYMIIITKKRNKIKRAANACKGKVKIIHRILAAKAVNKKPHIDLCGLDRKS